MSQPESSSMSIVSDLFKIVMKGEWGELVHLCESDLEAKRARITSSGYTVLHLAVSDGMEDVVESLIYAIGDAVLFSLKDDAGNTPLHIAASIGNVRMCKLFADFDPTLIGNKNNDGETPLFLAALHGKKDAFLCLHFFCLPDEDLSYCRRHVDGNSILHCAIAGEYFDLAFQIIHLYKDLVGYINSAGLSPLHFLACKPSAFKSGSNLGRFQKMVYKILIVKKLKADETYQEKKASRNEPNPSCPQNYQTLVNFFGFVGQIFKCEADTRKDKEPENFDPEKDLAPPNYVTCFGFVKIVSKAMLVLTGYGGVRNILDEKRKHTWSLQVLDELVRITDLYVFDNAGEVPRIEDRTELILTVSDTEADGSPTKKSIAPVTTKKASAILIAAKHGIIEILEKILTKFPVAIHDTEENKKNIVLIALENRQLEVYKLLLRKFSNNEGMFRKVDKDGNGALHFAATLTEEHPKWPIPGDALQMQWEIKWLKFVEESKPKHFFVRYNSKDKTPDQIFTKTHSKLVESGGEWMKKTAESCSLVAALIATVAFATSTALPGGVDEKSGKPHLETKPGFQVFAIASLIALCFSVTSLVMFLAILTSRYQEKDFGKNLPWKLLLGLTSLFLSIASMLVSFCSGHFFVLEDTIRYAAFPVYALTSVPVTFFAAAQFPLYFDLIRATFRSPFADSAESCI